MIKFSNTLFFVSAQADVSWFFTYLVLEVFKIAASCIEISYNSSVLVFFFVKILKLWEKRVRMLL